MVGSRYLVGLSGVLLAAIAVVRLIEPDGVDLGTLRLAFWLVAGTFVATPVMWRRGER